MDLRLTEDQQFFQETTRRFVESETPIATVRALHESGDGFAREWWRQAAELGWTSMLVPEARGGGSLSGGPVADAAIVAEEIGRGCAPGPFVAVNVVAAALGRAGGAAHEDVLGALLAGESIAAWAYAEHPSRWDAAGLGATAQPEGNDIVLDGTKAYVEAGAAAEHLLVSARTGDGLTQVLVPAATTGITVTPAEGLDIVRRFATVHLDRVRVPIDHVVGEVGGAADDVEHQLQIALALLCAEMVGCADRTFELTFEYMHDRHAFGRPIASFQALKHRVADMLVWLESCKATADGAARAVDAEADDASKLVSVAKTYVGRQSTAIVQECMQFLGGISQTWEHDVHLYLRRATVDRAVYGTPEQHEARLAALLGV